MPAVATKFAPQEIFFQQAVEAGFACAEIWTDAAVLDDWQQVADRARRYPLRYGIHFPNTKELTPAALRNCVALYEALGCRAMVMHRPQYRAFGEELLKLKPDLVLAQENHRYSPAKLAAWAEETEHLTLDVEHVWKFTLDDAPLEELWATLDRLLSDHGGKVRHVHLPGYCPGYAEHRPMYCNRDFVFGVLDRLDAIDYDGLIVSEVDLAFQKVNDLRMDVLLLETWHQRRDASPGERAAAERS